MILSGYLDGVNHDGIGRGTLHMWHTLLSDTLVV